MKHDRSYPDISYPGYPWNFRVWSFDNFVLVESIRWQEALFCRRRMCRTIFFILPARKKISPSNVIPYIPSCKLIKLVIAKVVFSQLEAELVEKKTRKENELRKKGRERNPFFPWSNLFYYDLKKILVNYFLLIIALMNLCIYKWNWSGNYLKNSRHW